MSISDSFKSSPSFGVRSAWTSLTHARFQFASLMWKIIQSQNRGNIYESRGREKGVKKYDSFVRCSSLPLFTSLSFNWRRRIKRARGLVVFSFFLHARALKSTPQRGLEIMRITRFQNQKDERLFHLMGERKILSRQIFYFCIIFE